MQIYLSFLPHPYCNPTAGLLPAFGSFPTVWVKRNNAPLPDLPDPEIETQQQLLLASLQKVERNGSGSLNFLEFPGSAKGFFWTLFRVFLNITFNFSILDIIYHFDKIQYVYTFVVRGMSSIELWEPTRVGHKTCSYTSHLSQKNSWQLNFCFQGQITKFVGRRWGKQVLPQEVSDEQPPNSCKKKQWCKFHGSLNSYRHGMVT